MNTDRDMNKTMTDIFLNVIFNWSEISQNQQVMSALDMRQNSMCRYYKSINPTIRDSFVQAHVLTVLLMMFLIVAMPIQNVFDETGDNNAHLLHESGSIVEAKEE